MDKIKIIRRITKKLVSAPGAPGEKTWTQHPVPDDLTEEFNVPFRGRDGNELYADIYMPKETGGEKLPVIVIVHGGGLFAGKPAAERGAAEVFARKGYLVFVPSYRMLMDANACEEISDICAGFDFAGQEAESRGGDPDRVFVIAESAGAFLTEYAAAMQKSEKLCGQIGYEPPYTAVRAIAFVSGMFYTTRKDPLGMFYPSAIYGERIKDDGFMAYMDPENAEVIKNLPPSILLTSRNDFLRGYTMKYAEALKKAGIPNRLVYYAEKKKELVHAFVTLWPELPEAKDAAAKIDEWFRNV